MEYPQPQKTPQEQSKKYWFFGSKLNTALLLILIILMVIAIRIMMKDSGTYFSMLSKKLPEKSEQTISFLKSHINGKETNYIFDECKTKDGSYVYKKTFKGEGVGSVFYNEEGIQLARFSMRVDAVIPDNKEYKKVEEDLIKGSCRVIFDKPYQEDGITIDTYNLSENK